MLLALTSLLPITFSVGPSFAPAMCHAPAVCLLPRAAGPPRLAVEGDDDMLRLRQAGLRVVDAAKKFGSAQEEQARAWVDEAIDSQASEADTEALLEKQLVLFEECLLDDEGGKCKELDAALTALEVQLKVANDAKGIKATFEKVKLDRALARVRKAAGKFGPEHERSADAWAKHVRATKSANPVTLLEQQEALFGECLLDDDGETCRELQDSLEALQGALGVRGKVVSTANLI